MPKRKMKKYSQKLTAFVLATIMLCFCAFQVYANQYDSENGATGNITAQENGFTDISFSNGYKGYCIDRYKKGAEINQNFTDTESTEYATNNITGNDISQKLKVLFTQCFETIFTADSNGGYILDPNMESPVSFAVYHFAGEQDYIWAENKALVQTVNAYSGPSVPDHGYQLELNNGDVITFDFTVFTPNNSDTHQCFFAYRINTEHTDPHEHSYGETWSSDDTNHWQECSCGDKTNEDPHEGETRGYVAPGEFQEGYTGDIYCTVCDKLLSKGEIIPQTHKHTYPNKWKYDANNHWQECSCGDKTNEDPHEGETRGYVAPGEFQEGYTGDTFCKVCNKLLAKGNSLPQTHKHFYPDEWKSDDTGHWNECECGDKTNEGIHIEEIRNQVNPGEFQEGYTGDTFCKVCNKLLVKGKIIPQTHKHSYPDIWKSDEENHWRECKCGNKQGLTKHKGNKGNCINKPICEICKDSFGTIDKNTHTGNIEIRNSKEATADEAGYTGDTYCKDCDELLKKGEIILPKPIMPSEPQETTPPTTEPTVNPSNPSTEPTLPSEPIEETDPSTEPIQPITKPEIPQETQTPTTPITKPTSSAKSDQAMPETGDAANIVPFVILVLVSGTIISIITPKLWNRRKSK